MPTDKSKELVAEMKEDDLNSFLTGESPGCGDTLFFRRANSGEKTLSPPSMRVEKRATCIQWRSQRERFENLECDRFHA